MMKILVTGSVGFIGFHLTIKLLEKGYAVIGLDNINEYYDVNLKLDRIKEMGIDPKTIKYGKFAKSQTYKNYKFLKLDLKDREGIFELFHHQGFSDVCNLAAQAGVRYSFDNPYTYIDSNVIGFLNILEACRRNNVKNICYASSSGVYGLNESQPFSTHRGADHPISIYAATKKSNELMAHAYSKLYNISTTGLRFFSVYGPWGRPDMALFIFVKNILEDKPVDIYNYGKMKRDFTYIDDIIEGTVRAIEKPAKANINWSGLHPDHGSSRAPYVIYNIGNGKPTKLLDFVEIIEDILGKRAKKNMLPLQSGDVPETYADTTELENDLGYKPRTDLHNGVKKFVDWYKKYYKS